MTPPVLSHRREAVAAPLCLVRVLSPENVLDIGDKFSIVHALEHELPLDLCLVERLLGPFQGGDYIVRANYHFRIALRIQDRFGGHQ